MAVSISVVFFLFLILLHVSLISVKFSLHDFREQDYISRSQTGCIKGFAALCIVLVHLTAVTEGGRFAQVFNQCGSPLVALFFFYSGYGTMFQYNSRGEAYLKDFPRKKLKNILLPWCILALFAPIYYWLGAPSTAYIRPSAPLQNAFELLGEWVPNGWFIFVILLFEFAFYLLARFLSNKHLGLIIGYSVFTAAYMLAMYLMDIPFWWYYRCHCFLLGLIWCEYEQKLVQSVKKHFGLWWSALFLSTGVMFIWYISAGESFAVAAFMLVLFVALVQLTCMKVKFENPILQWLGKISMEIYLVHGLVLGLLRSSAIFVQEDWLYGALTVVLTLDISLLLHKGLAHLKRSAPKSAV